MLNTMQSKFRSTSKLDGESPFGANTIEHSISDISPSNQYLMNKIAPLGAAQQTDSKLLTKKNLDKKIKKNDN